MSIVTQVLLANPEYDRICNLILKSFPNACVISIEEVYNIELEVAFNKQFLRRISEDPKYKIIEAFHGTKKNCVQGIISNGFDINLNQRSAFGKGTYLSDSCSFSCSYAPQFSNTGESYIILCSLITKGPERGHIFAARENLDAIPKYVITFAKQTKTNFNDFDEPFYKKNGKLKNKIFDMEFSTLNNIDDSLYTKNQKEDLLFSRDFIEFDDDDN